MRAKADPTTWRNSDKGRASYLEARNNAQRQADEFGYDYGLEGNDVFKTWSTFMLPQRQNRTGHELRCEVVSPMRLENCKPGHGPVRS